MHFVNYNNFQYFSDLNNMPFTSRTEIPEKDRTDLGNISKMFPYIWAFKSRVVFALLFLVIAKLATVAVPIILKEIIFICLSPLRYLIFPSYF